MNDVIAFALIAATAGAVSAMRGRDMIPGGKADKRRPKDFDPVQLRKGMKVEREHSSDPKIQREIAMDHLTEDPRYYIELEKMEKKLERTKKKNKKPKRKKR